MYAAPASQKNHMAVYLSGIYMYKKLSDKFIRDYKATGKKMDVEKAVFVLKNPKPASEYNCKCNLGLYS